ncbi:50S ribosomal protein L18 [Patescibacteria group bacterium]|nr:50S ribosomal protein L18 [Patescibacteria group bacterium]
MISQNTKLRRLKRVRGKLMGNLGVPRLSVFRSNKNIWAQIIDDQHGRTIVTASTKNVATKGTKTEKATAVGAAIAAAALKLHVKKVRFDRGLFRYHGRVKALAEGARSNGLQF